MLIHNARAIATGLPGEAMRTRACDIRVEGTRITEMGRLSALPGEAVIDATDCVVMPGWVNTHHHLFQSLLKGIPAGINVPLLPWLSAVPVPWRKHFDRAELLRLAARIGIAELLLSGCTTVADHQYHYYPDMPFDASEAVFEEAEKWGVRLVLCRGGQTMRREVDVAPPLQCTLETLAQYLSSLERDVQRWHQPAPDAMRRVVSAPTTPTWSVPPEQLAPIARHARSLGIRLHSHLSETADYVSYCREVHGCTPLEFVERHEWLGPDVWYAHMVHLSPPEIARLAQTGTGVAHCPQSNCRLGSGVAPVPALLRAGAPVSLAVDGAASNEAADMFNEAHTAWMIHRAVGGAEAITAEDVLHIGTAGGARMLGLDAVGTLAVGQAADISIIALDQPRHMGLHDPLIAPVVSGGGATLRAVLVAGRVVVEHGQIPGLDLAALAAQAREAVARMIAAH